MTDGPYHATLTDHGDRFNFDRGGKYEKIEDGTPKMRLAAGEFCGWEVSDVPELAASKSPEAAAFAVLKNYVNDTGDASGLGIELRVNIYQLNPDREPDVDLTAATAGDFAALEEVRYRHLDENPVPGQLAHSIVLPGRVLGDVELSYLPTRMNVPDVLPEWTATVQDAIRHVIDGDEYPADVADWAGIDRPDPEAYRVHGCGAV